MTGRISSVVKSRSKKERFVLPNLEFDIDVFQSSDDCSDVD